MWEPQSADFFTREIDQAVLEGTADIALHSAKDLPIPLPRELELYAVSEGGDPRDALVSRNNLTLSRLPQGARVGTSSPSRRDQLKQLRADLQIVPIRGTIGERLQWIEDGRVDAVVVAKVALDRLGWSQRIADILPIQTHPLQGKLAAVGRRGDATLRSLLAGIDTRRHWGSVILAGAGPGHPELLTLQVQRAIEQAEIIFYDALVNPSILAAAHGECVFVGKRKGDHSHPQHEINQMIAEAAMNGKQVLRLKGGDPMIFGRASEEIEYLRNRLIDIAVYPGITAASAAAAFCEIPLTERGTAASVTFCTAWPEEHIRVPNEGTAVYYMSSHNLPAIVKRCSQQFTQPEDRSRIGIALVYNASRENQQTWQYSLAELQSMFASPAPPQRFPSPLLVIVGRSVRTGCRHNWWERQPLVWLTGTTGSTGRRSPRSRYSELPLIRITEPQTPTDVTGKLAELQPGDWILFTSRHGVSYFFTALRNAEADTRSLAGLNIGAVGHVTAAELERHGISADLIPATESSSGVVREFSSRKLKPARVWIPGSNRYLPTLQDGLSRLGHSVSRDSVYNNQPNTPADLPQGEQDWIWDEIHFTSPSTVQQFFHLFPEGPPAQAGIKLTAIGSATEQALQQQYRPDKEPTGGPTA